MVRHRKIPLLPAHAFAQGQLEVTNKRDYLQGHRNLILRSILYHNEYDINHISGINIESGRRICIPYFILSLLVIGPLLIFIDTLLFGLFSTLLAGNGQQDFEHCRMHRRSCRPSFPVLYDHPAPAHPVSDPAAFFTLCVLGSGFNTAFSRGFDELL